MPVGCPRCFLTTSEITIASTDGSAHMKADTCGRCGGLWLAGESIGAVYPELGEATGHEHDLRARSRETGGQTKTAVFSCPKCTREPIEFPFYEVRLDFCPHCPGVWIDGLEVLALGRKMEASGRNAPPITGGYRTNAMDAITRGIVRCKRCEREIALRDSLMTSDGPMCEACAHEFEANDSGQLDVADVAALRRAGVDPAQVALSKPVRKRRSPREHVGAALTAVLGLFAKPRE
jgi:Zn-finger nucleic acid-binding protein